MSNIKKKKQTNQKYVAIVIICIVVMIASITYLILFIGHKNKKEENTVAEYTEPQTEEERKAAEKEEIANMENEHQRMKRYIGVFLGDIEEGRYKDAYQVLNEDFKKRYFPTLESFTEYAKKYLGSSTLALTYNNIERLANNKTGHMYIVWTTVSDAFRPKLKEGEEQDETPFVIVEYDYNKYEMSFRVLTEEE